MCLVSTLKSTPAFKSFVEKSPILEFFWNNLGSIILLSMYFSFLLQLVFSTGSRYTPLGWGKEAKSRLPVALQPTLLTRIISQCSWEEIRPEMKTPRIDSKAPVLCCCLLFREKTKKNHQNPLPCCQANAVKWQSSHLCETGGRCCNMLQLLPYFTTFLIEKVTCNTTVIHMHC